MASLSIIQIQQYLNGISGITNLVGSNNIWLDIAGDGSTLPWIVLMDVAQPTQVLVTAPRISRMRLQVTIYAQTLASCDTIRQAVQAALTVQAAVTGQSWGVIPMSEPRPRGEQGGAYSVVMEYQIFEDLS